jgi:hypothetical protein
MFCKAYKGAINMKMLTGSKGKGKDHPITGHEGPEGE